MTRRNNARLAGFTFLVYIAVAFSGMIIGNRASAGDTAAARLASIAAHLPAARLAFILEMVGCFCALVLAVTLYAVTRDQDPDLALLAGVFRVAEGVIGGVSLNRSLGRIWLAGEAPRLDPSAVSALSAVLLTERQTI